MGASTALVILTLCGLVAAAAVVLQPAGQQRFTADESTTTMRPVKPVAESSVSTSSGDRVSQSWVDAVSQETGIGAVALDAYGRASLRLAREQPGCHLGWTTLAGIGGIESGHGTSHGAHVLADGTTSKPILGPALDGSAGMAGIRSDERSAQWDRAVGPMQFIASTWRQWGSDGNHDGVADPNNVIDAAYAAGRYLCASGADLRTGTGWTRAIFSYNHSDDYVRSVLARANGYASH